MERQAVSGTTLEQRGGAVMWTLGLGMANVGFYVASIGVVLVLLAQDLGLPVTSLAWFGSTFGAGLLAVALGGPLLLRLGPPRALALAAVILGTGSALLAFATTATPAYVGAVLQGIGAAGIILVQPGLVRGPGAASRLSVVNAAASIAGVSAPLLLGGAAILGLRGRLPLVLIAAAMAVLAVLALRLPATPAGPEQAAGRQPLARPLTVRRWLALVLAVSLEFFFVVWGVARLTGAGLAAGGAALVSATFPIGMALCRVFGPRLIARLPMMTVGSVLAGAGALLVATADAWPLVGLGLFLAGVGLALFYPICLAALMSTPGLRPELAASLGAFASGTAITVAPTGLALLASMLDLQAAFLVVLPVLVALLWLHREPRGALR